MISSLYGGRLAEELIYGAEKVSTGASNDIERATDIARKMVTQWVCPSVSVPCSMRKKMARCSSVAAWPRPSMSDDTARVIDAEVKQVIDRNYARSKQILLDNMDVLHSMKDALMKYETIDAKQIDDLMARREVRAPATGMMSTVIPARRCHGCSRGQAGGSRDRAGG